MTTHRTFEGDWAECLKPETCALKFHLPRVSVAEAAELPLDLLLPILSVMDPPATPDFWTTTGATRQQDGATWDALVVQMRRDSMWLERRDDPARSPLFHRDYDLPAVIQPDGHMEWYQHGKTHRDGDRPARVMANGTLVWCQHGGLHRENGQPAVIMASGQQEWFYEGQRHRAGNLPAIILPDGTCRYFQYDVEVDEEGYRG